MSIQPNQAIVNSGGAGSPVHYIWNAYPPPHPSTTQAETQAEMQQYLRLRDQTIAKHVPRPQFTPSQQSFRGITFSANGWPGVHVDELIRGLVFVDCPTDAIFAHHGWRETTVALHWPGYLPKSSDASRRRIKTIRQGSNIPISRQDFAKEIAILINDLYNCAKDKPVAHGCEDWAFSKNNFQMSDVIIVSAHYYRNVWVPELYVRFRNGAR